MVVNEWKRRYQALVEHPGVASGLILANLIGTVWGLIAWYGDQLVATPWYLWIFVPDSPGNAFLFIPALLLILRRRPGWPWLNALAAFGNIKYGAWTVVFWALYWTGGGPVTWMGVAMTFTHLGMVLEGVYLLGYSRAAPWFAVGLGIWFLINDWVDYGSLGLHPGLPDAGLVPMMAVAAVVSTLALTMVVWRIASARRPQPATP